MKIDQGKLLRGKPIIVENVGVLSPIIIDEIVDIGEKTFYQYLNNLCFEMDDLNFNKEDRQKLIDDCVSPFQLIASSCYQDVNFLQMIIKAFKFFFKEDVCFIKQLGIFFLGDFNEYRFITLENYESIKSIIRLQNCLSKDDVLNENPKDEHVRMLLEKRRKIREKLAKAKAKNNEGDESEPITFADLISIMCSNANGFSNDNVWNMCFYFFQNQFQRMKLIEDYDISIRSLLAGADSNEVDIKHYISHL